MLLAELYDQLAPTLPAYPSAKTSKPLSGPGQSAPLS